MLLSRLIRGLRRVFGKRPYAGEPLVVERRWITEDEAREKYGKDTP